jgi:5-methylcytosine-specific restriction endonuclease McrA
MLKVKRIQLGKQAYRRLLKRVLERDGWRCQKCGSLKDLQVHHQRYRSRQATTVWSISLPCAPTATCKSTVS